MSNPLQPIAAGRTAEIYPYEGDKVLKLFFPTVPRSWIDKEVDIGRYVQDAQLPSGPQASSYHGNEARLASENYGTFVRSFPNYIPLSAQAVRRSAERYIRLIAG